MNVSKDSNDEEMITMLEEMQDQIEDMEDQLRETRDDSSKAQEEISKLSSENFLLRSELQRKSEIIVSQNEKLGMLQKSDQAEVSAAKENYDTLTGQLDNREQRIIKREKEIEYRIRVQDAEVARLSEEKIHDRMRQMEREHQKRQADLNSKYKRMRGRYDGIIFMAVAYGLLTTVITAIKTEVIIEDAFVFVSTIANGIIRFYESAVMAGDFVSQLSNCLPWDLAAVVMHWILIVLTVAVIIDGAALMAFLTIRAYIRFFKDRQADEITTYAVLMDMAVVLFLADEIKSVISANLIRMFILIFAVYSLTRAVLQAENTRVRDTVIKYVTIVGGSIGGVALMVHFFGVIGIIAIPIGLLLAGENR